MRSRAARPIGAVVRDPGGPQVVPRPRRGRDPGRRPHARWTHEWPRWRRTLRPSSCPSETEGVSMRMKNRWIGGLVLALAVALGACAPPARAGEPPTSHRPRRAWRRPRAPHRRRAPSRAPNPISRRPRTITTTERSASAGVLEAARAPGRGRPRSRPRRCWLVAVSSIFGSSATRRQTSWTLSSPRRAAHRSEVAGRGRRTQRWSCPRSAQGPSGSEPAGA